MKKSFMLIFAIFTIASLNAQNAIKKVIVETYYISDANDATDTIGGKLEPGSKTYRVYIQMEPGCMIQKLYGNERHTLKILSTANFFNNIDRGKTFGKDIRKIDFKKNTVALDTWLTLGQTSTTINGITYFGVPKTQDTDGSLIGGVNNNGGSAGIPDGLLINNDPLAGIPLTTSDGMDTLVNIPNTWFDYGLSESDSTIFGSEKAGNEFVSNSAIIQNSGVMGVLPNDNQVIVAQLTTTGEISFELNVEIKECNGSITKYVAKDDTLDEKLCTLLIYPPECGCMNPNYLEYKNTISINNMDSCKTLIVLGCMDPHACNYDSTANYNVQSLCCYPGLCQDRDISLVCPSLGETSLGLKIYPNPVQNQMTLEISAVDNKETKYAVYNFLGTVEFEKYMGIISGTITQDINLSKLNPGIYMIRLYSGAAVINKTFIKN